MGKGRGDLALSSLNSLSVGFVSADWPVIQNAGALLESLEMAPFECCSLRE